MHFPFTEAFEQKLKLDPARLEHLSELQVALSNSVTWQDPDISVTPPSMSAMHAACVLKATTVKSTAPRAR